MSTDTATTTQRIIEITSPAFLRESALPAVGGPAVGFPVPERPLCLEIGCGTGHFLVEMAQRHPERNFLGIDIYNKGCHKSCARIDRLGLDNARVMRIEARYLLSRYLAAESLAAVYINCPDPWPKKRHRDRRLVNAEFLDGLLRYLRPEGELIFSTDFADYATTVAALLPQLSGYRNLLPAPCVTELPGYPVSKYMRRFLDRGQPIHYLHLARRADLDAAGLPQLQIASGFRTRRLVPVHA